MERMGVMAEMERKGRRVHQDRTDEMALRERKVLQETTALKDHLVLLDLRDPQVEEVEGEDHQGRQDTAEEVAEDEVLLVHQDLREEEGLLVTTEIKDRKDLRVPKVLKVQLGLALSDLLDHRVLPDPLDHQAVEETAEDLQGIQGIPFRLMAP